MYREELLHMENQKVEVEVYNGAGYELYRFNSQLEASLFMNEKLFEAKEKLVKEGKNFETCYETPYIYLKGKSNVIHFQMRVSE
jgi:hypothetical protein